MIVVKIIGIIIVCSVVLMLYSRRSPYWVYKALIRPVLSKVVNYTIYYFRRFILFETVEKAKREHYGDYAKRQRRLHKKKTLINIAIVNKNRNKYTETFVDFKIKLLKSKYYVHQLYGGYFPTSEVHENHLLSNSIITVKFIAWWELFWNKGENHYLKRAFRNYLKRENIKIVFAEFGTCGVEIFEECKKAGVPLIVTFRGYDIHHKDIFGANHSRYRDMIEYSSKIICVSKDILHKISDVYGFENKLIYIPSEINLDLFKCSDHSKNPPIFLSVGRFSETKSPHLVILSFFEVLKEIPDAKLVMVGKDGGGELFESCLILAKALGIDKSIEFKGILSPIQVRMEMQKARVFVQHSLTAPLTGDKEGTPVSLREAMACGLPVVATRHAGIAESIIHGETGLLVEEYDYLAMAREMVRVCKSDELVLSLGRRASDSIRGNVLIFKNKEILEELVESHRLR